MTELQRRVLIEAEFLFYLVTSPTLFSLPRGDVHVLVGQISTPALQHYNAEARARLREGSLAARPQPPIKVVASTPDRTPEMVQK